MHAAFDASHHFDLDLLRTADEIQRCGEELLFWLETMATSNDPPWPDLHLIRAIHRRWFDTTFPAEAGIERSEMVLNRKSTAAPVESILLGVDNACGNWCWRRQNHTPPDGPDFIEFIVAEANTLAVTVYDVHPFIDGNTRTTWHLRNYLLMRDGLRPLTDLRDEDEHDAAWWAAKPHDHEWLDRVILEALAAQEL